MSKDLPDYTRKMVIEYTGGFVGLEELAARLKSIVPWDLRGNVLLMEDFETEETEWVFTDTGGASAVTRQSRHKHSGNWAIKLFVDDVADAKAFIQRYIAYPGAVKCGLFCRAKFNEDAQDLRLAGEFWDGTDRYNPVAKYDRANTTLSIWDNTLGEVPLDTALSIAHSALIWVPWLITFNLKTGLWDKIRFADMEYDISAYSMTTTPVIRAKYGIAHVSGRVIGTTGFTMYVDDIVLVKNMP